jgi:hypothetical protein
LVDLFVFVGSVSKKSIAFAICLLVSGHTILVCQLLVNRLYEVVCKLRIYTYR